MSSEKIDSLSYLYLKIGTNVGLRRPKKYLPNMHLYTELKDSQGTESAVFNGVNWEILEELLIFILGTVFIIL